MVNESILRAFVRTLLNEARGFDLTRFKTMSHTEKIEYSASLPIVGTGSSRRVHVLSSRYALKVALNERGVHQNRGEAETCTDPEARVLLAAVKDHDGTYEWLVSELVRPISSESDFNALAPIPWKDLMKVMKGAIPLSFFRDGGEMDEFVQTVAYLEKEHLTGADLEKLDSWGKTSDGRLVILDYGMTRANYRQVAY